MRRRITKRVVDAVKPEPRRVYVWDTELTGFGLKVMPSGRKIYVFQYRPRGSGRRGTARRVTIGRHGELTAEQARKIADGFLVSVRSGGDPAGSRRSAGSPAPTVSDLAEHFVREYLPNKKRPPRESTIGYYGTLFRCHILPALGRRRVDLLTAAELERLHASMRITPYVANRTLSLLQQALDQAERWGWRPQHTNPAIHIDRYPEDRRGAKKEVMLSAKQMSQLLKAIDEEEEEHGTAVACGAISVAFWTGWRIGEVLRLQWANVDLKDGTAKLLRTKTAHEEYRQLPAEAIAILKGLSRVAGCPYVFPGQDLAAHLTTVRKPWERIRKTAGLEDLDGLGALRIHDLRHNIVSWDVSRGVALEIAGKNVGHRSRRATEVYAHFAPSALKRAADERAAAMRAAVEEMEGS